MNIISIIFGSISIIYVVIIEIYVIYISKKWNRAQAVILKSEITNAKGDIECLESDIQYSYSIKGKKITNNKISPYNFSTSFEWIHKKLLKKYSINTEVSIYYCPNNPKRSYLDLKSYRLSVISSAIILGMLFIYLGLK